MYKAIFNTICDFQEILERSIFWTKLGTFGKMEPYFVIPGNFNNDHARNLKTCMQISVVEEIRNMQWRESISIILEITVDQNIGGRAYAQGQVMCNILVHLCTANLSLTKTTVSL